MIDVIVTGASGFIGKALVSRLEKSELKFLALDSKAGNVAKTGTWDILPKAEVVVHLAGRSFVPHSWEHSEDFIRTNVLGTEQCLNYCKRVGARLVFISTYVYGVPKSLPVSENHPVHPNNPYALSKRMAEELCEFAAEYRGVNSTILRLFNVYGIGQRDEFLIPTIINQAKAGKEIHVMDTVPRRDYVYLEDVINAIMLAMEIKSGCNIFNIGSGVSHSVREVIDIVQRVAGTNVKVVSEGVVRENEIQNVIADVTRAREVLGWKSEWGLEDGVGKLL